jgi:hypothetical protein
MAAPVAWLGGPVGKLPFFQISHTTKVSTQIHLSIPQYDVYKVSLKKNEWKVFFGGVKANIFAPRAQQVGCGAPRSMQKTLKPLQIKISVCLYDFTIHSAKNHPLVTIVSLITIGFRCRRFLLIQL